MKLQKLLARIAEGELAIRVELGSGLSGEIDAFGGDADRIAAITAEFGDQKVESIRMDEAERLEITTRRPA